VGIFGVVGVFDVDGVGWVGLGAQFAFDVFFEFVGVLVELVVVVVVWFGVLRFFGVFFGGDFFEYC